MHSGVFIPGQWGTVEGSVWGLDVSFGKLNLAGVDMLDQRRGILGGCGPVKRLLKTRQWG